jgi:hypothetical protein
VIESVGHSTQWNSKRTPDDGHIQAKHVVKVIRRKRKWVSCIVDGGIVCDKYINATGCLHTILLWHIDPLLGNDQEQTMRRWLLLGTGLHATMEVLLEVVFSMWSALRLNHTTDQVQFNPCGCGVEYLHRDPESRRRRRKGKSQIWDSKIQPQVPRD